MPRKQSKPVRLILYALVPLMVVALVLLGGDRLPAWANEVVGIGIVFSVFGAIALWVYLNTSALLDEEVERAKHEKLVITEYPPKQPRKKPRDGDGDNDSASYDPFQINQVTHYRN